LPLTGYLSNKGMIIVQISDKLETLNIFAFLKDVKCPHLNISLNDSIKGASFICCPTEK